MKSHMKGCSSHQMHNNSHDMRPKRKSSEMHLPKENMIVRKPKGHRDGYGTHN